MPDGGENKSRKISGTLCALSVLGNAVGAAIENALDDNSKSDLNIEFGLWILFVRTIFQVTFSITSLVNLKNSMAIAILCFRFMKDWRYARYWQWHRPPTFDETHIDFVEEEAEAELPRAAVF